MIRKKKNDRKKNNGKKEEDKKGWKRDGQIGEKRWRKEDKRKRYSELLTCNN